MNKIIALMISLVILMLLILGMFLVYALHTPNYPKNNLPVPDTTIISEQHVSYLVNEIGAYKLKSYLGNPKIIVEVDKEKFNSEVNQGKIITKKGEIQDADIKIITMGQEIINIINSGDINSAIKDSVASGRTNIELVASYSTLFGRGYLSLYQDITGKSLTGSTIKIFSNW